MRTTKEALFTLAITELPSVIGLLKGAFAHKHPNLPEPTSEEVIAAWHEAVKTSIAKDVAFIDAHRNP